MTEAARTVTVLSHTRPAQTGPALRSLMAAAAREGVTLRFDSDETRKFELVAREGLELDAPLSDDVELCIVLGGDGTILRALQLYARTGVPVFGINFGEVGFLATVEPNEAEEGMRRALEGDFEVMRLPAIELGERRGATRAGFDDDGQLAINDVA
ncbi:MAG: NAD(+)/NADH kinase, partial [Solirubrobacteraceae bacterium]